MVEVCKEDYQKYIQFAEKGICNRVYPLSIVEGNQNGQIFVDSFENPICALFWHQCGFAYISGDPIENFLSEITALIRDEKRMNNRRFLLQVYNKDWERYFGKQTGITRAERYCFGFEKTERLNKETVLADGYVMREIDELLLPRISGNIIPPFSWDSDIDFLHKGKGFCILYGNDIAATAFSSAVSHDEIDIGIETNEKYCKCGLATILAKRMIQYILEERKIPVWECHTKNIGSRSVAEKAGFYLKGMHPFFRGE